jgi:hypothetical protein
MAESSRDTLSIGVFLIIIVVAIVLYAAQVITDWTLIIPIILVLSGCWTLVLAGMRASNPQKLLLTRYTLWLWCCWFSAHWQLQRL